MSDAVASESYEMNHTMQQQQQRGSWRSRSDSLSPDDAFLRFNTNGTINPNSSSIDGVPRVKRPNFDDYDFLAFNQAGLNYSRLSTTASTRGSLVSSRTSVSSVQTTVTNSSIWSSRTPPWERKAGGTAPSSRPVSLSARSIASQRSLYRQNFPDEVYDHILNQLDVVHRDSRLNSCPACFTRDLYNLCLVNKAWTKVARRRLYRDVSIVPPEMPSLIKKYKLKATSARLVLLRRTLRASPNLAGLVHSIHMPLPVESGPGSLEASDQLASLVMSCPNLQRLTPPRHYSHEFTRLDHAISTRAHLQEHVWLIASNEETTERSYERVSGIMTVSQISMFMDMHKRWKGLTHLSLHAMPDGILEHYIFEFVFAQLSSLTHLSISNFDKDDFRGPTLLSLPLSLRSLRLENLPGLKGPGLVHWAAAQRARNLKKLLLIDVPIPSLSILRGTISRITNLVDLVFVQNTPITCDESLIFHPLLTNPSIRRMTWDLRPSTPAAYFPSPYMTQAFPNGSSSIQISCPSFSTTGSTLYTATTPFATAPPSIPSPATSVSTIQHPSTMTNKDITANAASSLSDLPGTPLSLIFPRLLPSTDSQSMASHCLPPAAPDDPCALLAASISHGGFPALRRLVTPSDPHGALQAVCTPRFRFALPGDKFRSETRLPDDEYALTLHAARTAAERRVAAAREGALGGQGVGGVEIRIEDVDWDRDGEADEEMTLLQLQQQLLQRRNIDKCGQVGAGNRRTSSGTSGGGRAEFQQTFVQAQNQSRKTAKERVIARTGWVGVWNRDDKGIEYVIGERGRVEADLGLEERVATSAAAAAATVGKGSELTEKKKREREKEREKERISARGMKVGTCTGQWNQEHGQGRKWWRHEERERQWPKNTGLWN